MKGYKTHIDSKRAWYLRVSVVVAMLILLIMLVIPLGADAEDDGGNNGTQEITNPETSTGEENAEGTIPPASTLDAAGSISGLIWVDGDGSKTTDWDGLFNGNEAPLAGFAVYLFDASDRTTPLDTTKTGQDGTYTFTNLEPGDYVVGIKDGVLNGTEYHLPLKTTAESVFTIDYSTADENPPYYATGFSKVITITSDEAVKNVSAGMRLSMAIKAADYTYIATINLSADSKAL